MNYTAALRLEKALAFAHQSLSRAAYTAEGFDDQSTADDLWQLTNEVRRLNEDLLKRRRARQTYVRTGRLGGGLQAPAHGSDERPDLV